MNIEETEKVMEVKVMKVEMKAVVVKLLVVEEVDVTGDR